MSAAGRVTKTKTEAGWIVTATWETKDGKPLSEGPAEVSVSLAVDADPKVKVRGYTTGVARRVERLISEMQAEVVGQPETAHLSGISARALRGAVARMPDSPRKGADEYYRGLLALFDMLDAAGHPAPINVLSDRLGVPKQTIKTQLATARQRYR
ncbi:hypothetical protein [Plantactinospora endophytica]|uniref:Uncharacterized protein n=1 Tax=Plantactinospora endophytica TaxID=673535 RepID=A0ABQ4ECB1_9ACTN|nr:hypothetical protein [Plantactinospora endophytica]GIG92373.1 hypothetical protein Pen02_73090 [Plantactinospora endophytica]